MEAQDVMTRNVVTTSPEVGVEEIARLLIERHISAVPVVDGAGKLLGIVSEGDLVRRPEVAGERKSSWWLTLISDQGDLARDYLKTHGRRAQDIMTRDVVSVAKTTSVAEIARLLEEKRIKRVPVVDGGKLVGIVSRADLLRAMAARPAPAAARDDDRAILAALQEILHREGWDAQLLNVVVEDGTVHLWGLVQSPDVRRALRLAAEEVSGVSKVETHFTAPPTWT